MTIAWSDCVSIVVSQDSVPKCTFHVTESIPRGLNFTTGPVFNSTYHELKQLVSSANKTLDITAFYFTLIGEDVMPDAGDASDEGEDLLQTLVDAIKRGVKTRIAVGGDGNFTSSRDLEQLEAAGAEIRPVNFTRLQGTGVLHTKFLVADRQAFYVGSANMDWRSLTQVKEAGVTIRKCPVLAEDLMKIFEVYWDLGRDDSEIPVKWPAELETNINVETPLLVNLGGSLSDVFIASSPKPFNPNGRTNDIDALLHVINGAKKFINIAVMDYMPAFVYKKPQSYWPVIDDALRRAAFERGVRVRLLGSKWNHTKKNMYAFLRSLSALKPLSYPYGKIQAKVFVVPSTSPDQTRIPFARVNHNKYMVTDESAYIGTSNWSADYFVNTAGVSIVSHENNGTCYRDNSLRESLVKLFDRDWFSEYAETI